MNVKLLIFDWDGTLMDSIDPIVHSMQDAIADLGLPPRSSAQIHDIIGLGLQEAVAALYPGADAGLVGAMAARYRLHWDRRLADVHLLPGVEETLDGLRAAGYLLAVATGKGRSGLEKALAQTGLGGCFAATRCADETCSKPHPQMLHELLAELGVAATAAAMVGDSVHDLEMANQAGVHGLGVTTGAHDRQRLLGFSPRAVFDRISELPAWLGTARQAVLEA